MKAWENQEIKQVETKDGEEVREMKEVNEERKREQSTDRIGQNLECGT